MRGPSRSHWVVGPLALSLCGAGAGRRARPGTGGRARSARPDPAEGLQPRLAPPGPRHDGGPRALSRDRHALPPRGEDAARTWTAG